MIYGARLQKKTNVNKKETCEGTCTLDSSCSAYEFHTSNKCYHILSVTGVTGKSGSSGSVKCYVKENIATSFTIKGKGSGSSEPLAQQLLSNASGSVLSITSVTVKLSDKCGGSTWPTMSFSSASCVGNGQSNVQRRLRKTCIGVAPGHGRAYDGWCNSNCNHNPPHCPASHCQCNAPAAPRPAPKPAPKPATKPAPKPSKPAPKKRKSCIGVAPGHGRSYDAWCNTNCNHFPPHCPATHCNCAVPVPQERKTCIGVAHGRAGKGHGGSYDA